MQEIGPWDELEEQARALGILTKEAAMQILW